MRRSITWIMAVCMVVCLAACGKSTENKEPGQGDKAASESAAQGETTEVEETKKGTKKTDVKLRILANPEVQESVLCMNENGYYYITQDSEKLKNGHYGRHMMYMDFATQKEVYLCSTSGCKHNSEECTSVLSEEDFPQDALIFCKDENLYLLSTEHDRSGSTEMTFGDEAMAPPEAFAAALYRMNPDGSDRTKVYEFEEGLILENVVMEGGGAFYFIVKKMETRKLGKDQGVYTYSSERQLVRLDQISWTLENVYQFENSNTTSEWNVHGCFDDSIVLYALCYDHELTDEEMLETDREASMELIKKTKNQVAILNLTDLSLKVVYERSNKSDKLSDFTVKDEFLYESKEGKEEIRQINLKTGEKKVLAKFKNNNLMGVYDDVICCRSWDMTGDQTLYFVDRKDGSVSHCKLVNKSVGWALEIRGETKDKFLVVYDYDAESQGDDSYEITRFYHALIHKEDLYKGRGNYLPIKMVGTGE